MLTHLQALIEQKKNPDLVPESQGLQPNEAGSLSEVGFQPKRAAAKQTEGMTPSQKAKISNETNYGFNG
jgi:hypothetical protein